MVSSLYTLLNLVNNPIERLTEALLLDEFFPEEMQHHNTTYVRVDESAHEIHKRMKDFLQTEQIRMEETQEHILEQKGTSAS